MTNFDLGHYGFCDMRDMRGELFYYLARESQFRERD